MKAQVKYMPSCQRKLASKKDPSCRWGEGKFLLIILLLAIMLCAPATAAEFEISRAACKQLVQHQPNADVAYQARVDVRGKKVLPADSSSTLELSDTITLPLTVDLAQQFGLLLGMVAGSDARVGVVTITGNQAYFNGQPLSDEAQQNLAVLCLEPQRQAP